MEIAILRQMRTGDSEHATVAFRFGARTVCVTLETNEDQPVVVPSMEINTVGLERPVYVYGAIDLKACAEAYADGDGVQSPETDSYLLKALQKKAETISTPPSRVVEHRYWLADGGKINTLGETLGHAGYRIGVDFAFLYGNSWNLTGIVCYNLQASEQIKNEVLG